MSLPPLPPLERDPRQPADFDPIKTGKALLRGTRSASLGTLDPRSGFPLTTLVSLATDYDGAPVMLVSGLSNHTKNLKADPRCSVLLSQGGKGDPLAHPRLSVMARAQIVQDPDVRRRYLARHPKAALYVDFPDFAFFRLAPENVHLNGGFARAFDGDARYLLTDVSERASFAALEASAIAHMNADHAATNVLFATRLCGMMDGAWRATSLDPDGLDLALGDLTARLPFEAPVQDATSLRSVLGRLAEQARDASSRLRNVSF